MHLFYERLILLCAFFFLNSASEEQIDEKREKR